MGELVGLFILVGTAGLLLLVILGGIVAFEARRPTRHAAGYALARGMPVDPGEGGLEYESWTLSRPGGVELPVWEVKGGQVLVDADEALTGVFVHGWGQSRLDMLARSEVWRPLVSRLVLYDLRGHGDATGGRSTLGQGEDEDLIALLAQLGRGRFVLAGHSMGAVIALAAAASNAPPAERIAGLVAFGPYLDFHTSLQGRLRRAGLPTRPITDVGLAWLRLLGVRPLAATGTAASLRCPLLVVHGEHDRVCPPAHGRSLAETAPRGELVVMRGAGHLDAATVDPRTHDEAITRFVGSLETPFGARSL